MDVISIRKLKEYSKKVIAAMVVLWFIGAAFGAIVVSIQVIRNDYNVAIDSLLTYIGVPIGGGIVTYLLKTAFENKEKIKQDYKPDYVPSDGIDRVE